MMFMAASVIVFEHRCFDALLFAWGGEQRGVFNPPNSRYNGDNYEMII